MKKILFLLFCFAATATSAFADNDKPISVNELPAPAKQFITTHFADSKVSYAKMETELFDKSYDVIFVDGNKVEFNKKGEWKSVKCKYTQVPLSIIPQKIQDYIKTHFQEMKVIEIEANPRNYEVKLNNGLELIFDLKFNFIGIDD